MMTPHDAVALVPVFAAGTGLGALFFGGLWWTVNRLLLGRLSIAALVGGLVVRVGVSLAGFLAVAGHQWQRWLVCLAGFIAVRMIMGRLVPMPDALPARTLMPRSPHHAP